jgi:2-desacetyl-2-hydroxyethyl bacteriochlorophyllide A dehydrogenase
MKAIAINKYGGTEVLQYTDIPEPQIKPDQLLVKIHASSVNPVDWKIRYGHLQLLTGYNFPLVLGFDAAGIVTAVGDAITRFQVGDSVYAYLKSLPGGADAEYAAVSESAAGVKPDNMSYEEAAGVPLAAITALQGLRNQGQILPGHKVLVNGASGGVGTFAVQIAKAIGAEVTGVCSRKNTELVESLGADRVIDYTTQDFTKNAVQYDIIFDAVGKQSFSQCKKVLQPNGVYVTTLPSTESLVQSAITFVLPGQKAKLIVAQSNSQDLAYLKDLITADKVRTVIDRTFPLSELAEAHTYSEAGHAVGKIIITMT